MPKFAKIWKNLPKFGNLVKIVVQSKRCLVISNKILKITLNFNCQVILILVHNIHITSNSVQKGPGLL